MKNSFLKRYKNITFYILVLILISILLYLFSFFSMKYLDKFFYHKNFYHFVENKIQKLNHVRGLDYTICNNFKNPKCFLYTEYPSLKKFKDIVLINGDSWAVQMVSHKGTKLLNDKSKKKINNIKEFGNLNELNIILSGISSYSPSLMQAQYHILYDEYKIKPNYILSIIDQTDLGDEICRYKNFRKKQNEKVTILPFNDDYINDPYHYGFFLERNKIYYSNDSDFLKLIKISIAKIKNKIIEKNNKIKCPYHVIQKKLTNELSKEDKLYFHMVINDYVNEVFKNNKLKKLLIVTHPHKQHLIGFYKNNVINLLKENLKDSKYLDKIIFINFHNEFFSINDYEENDVASHLKPKSYNRYLNKILSELKNEIK